MARRKFTREFPFDCAQGEVSAVKMVNEQGCTVAEASKNLGVDANSIRGWVAKFGGAGGVVPAGDGALMAEVRQLRKENARLLMEREILKKAAQFFAREQP